MPDYSENQDQHKTGKLEDMTATLKENLSCELDEYQAEWEKMTNSPCKQAGRERFYHNKYGMFIHWGLYSIPAGIWNDEKMEEGGEGPCVAEWIMRRKAIPRSEYEKLAARFNPVDFNADAWAGIAKAAGMKYIVITAKHHEGFAMFKSFDPFNVVDATPFGRDIIAELHDACARHGLDFGVYYSHSLDWRDGGDGGMKAFGPPLNPRSPDFPNYFDPAPVTFCDYIEQKSLPQVRELTGNYSDLCEIWFDTPLYIPAEISFEFYRCVYERQPRALVSERIGNGMGDILIPGDNTIPDKVQRLPWECIATTNNSWGYNCYDNDWKSPREILFWLISAAVRGGNLLLNLGPLPSGALPPDAVKSINVVGKWLEINGDAIYDSVPWQVTHEGPTEVVISSTEQRKEDGFTAAFSPEDLFFTCKDNRIFAISLVPFDKDWIVIRSLAGSPVASVRLPGTEVSVDWELRADGLAVKRPDDFHSHELGYVVEIELKSE